LVCWLAENIPGVAYMIGKDSGIFNCRKLAFIESPTYYPFDQITYLKMMKNPNQNQSLEEMLAILTEVGYKNSSLTQTSLDFHKAYKSLNTSPVDIAHSIISTLSENEQYRFFLIKFDQTDILNQAKESELRYKSGTPIGPLDGVPIAIKDEMDCLPYETSVGTSFLKIVPKKDSNIVARLRKAGALIIGKTNMHEFGLDITNSNAFWGTPRNPHNTDHYTGGSSGGSAAIVSAGLCPLAIGADGGGSIRIPASYCGVFGLKPTCGRISGDGSYPLDSTTGVVGPISSSAYDLALSYILAAGPLESDPNSILQPPVSIENFNNIKSLKGVRLGVFWEYFNDGPREVVATCKAHLDQMVKLGAEIVEIIIPNLSELHDAHSTTIISEMSNCVKDLPRRNMSHPSRVAFAVFDTLSQKDFLSAAQMKTRGMNCFRSIFQKVDVIVTPTTIAAPKVHIGGLKYGISDYTTSGEAMKYIFASNLLGFPSLTCPVGFDQERLPIGILFQSKWWNEDMLLRMANVSESITENKLHKPELHHSFELSK
jgi:Asp-tRNA(Asn)/Glu-tRNA(Gln) amidotransferase A subunit family amidase